ncbi:MAG: transglycosylase domain-containing protein [bacterium]|nr:transglycosylase domain-containing protein [bacterium]
MDKMRKVTSRNKSGARASKVADSKAKSVSKTASGASKRVASSKNNLGLYANLAHKRQTKKDAKARERAEYLASLPKNPVKRFFWHLHPKRVAKYWFSKKGLLMALKILGGGAALVAVLIIGLFIYFQKDLNQIKPEELAKRVQTTVNKYYDRNGELLWEDKGTGDYKLTVEGTEISELVKKATVAIEDRDFYKHSGIDLWAILRSVINNFRGGATQGGSTLTQQLIKQVYFSDESSERGIAGIPRKIKEMILAIEVERMYTKDEILALYLNESPYGGRRNGVESGAQTYFGKSSKDLNLAEAALLAAIPNNPAVYNPYNTEYNTSLIKRQHKVLDDMVEVGYISEKEAKEAKEYDVLSTLKPETDQYSNMVAPHFVLEVKSQLEKELGVKVVGNGGLTINTTLDLRAQKLAEQAVATGVSTLSTSGADNIALTSVDVQTGQVIAQVGSIGYDTAGYGQTNAATANLDPGSSIKPIVDYAALFSKTDNVFTPGTILKDENIDKLYCGGNTSSSCSLRNANRRFYGNVSIRYSLGNSLNIAAVKALSIVGVNNGLQVAQDLGDTSYCANNKDAGLSAAIGGGCSVRQDEHTNAYASLARGGVYKKLTYVTKVVNSSNETLMEWKDESKEVVDKQAAYMITDILADATARTTTFGGQATSFGFNVPGVWTASKTGTTDDSHGNAKDSWMMSYSPVVATGVWSGNHDGSALRTSSNTTVRRVVNDYMQAVHPQVYGADGKWSSGDKIQRPEGIQNCKIGSISDICPSWWNSSKSNSTSTNVQFDSISKKKATTCTPESTRVTLAVYTTTDAATGSKSYTVSDPEYDYNSEDDVHNCDDTKPQINDVSYSSHSGNNYRINISIAQGKNSISSVVVKVDGETVSTATPSGNSLSVDYTFTKSGQNVTIEVRDSGGYTTSKSYAGPTIRQSSSSSGN